MEPAKHLARVIATYARHYHLTRLEAIRQVMAALVSLSQDFAWEEKGATNHDQPDQTHP